MKKETGVTIVIGIIMGVVVAFLIITTTKEKKSEKKKIIRTQIAPTVNITPKTVKQEPLTISAPENNFVTNDDSITIKGRAAKNSLIIVQSAAAERAVKNNIVPEFSLKFPLILGENILNLTAYYDNQIQKKTLYVYYLEKEE